VETASRKTQLFGGLAAVAAGVIVAAMVHAHPEGLRAPAWVAYIAASAFGLAGFSLLAGLLHAVRLQSWLGIAVVLSMLSISLWIAIGPGERACSMSIGVFWTESGDVICRGAFGLGSLLIALLLVLSVRRAIRRNGEA
jgi:uncharacterized membrane protein (DUF4010 family)